jgi:HEAT repeat protein
MKLIKQTWLALGFLPLVTMSVFAEQKVGQADHAQKAAQDALAKFQVASRGEAASGEPVWNVRMEALENLVKAGSAAAPILIDALNNGPPATRDFAAQALAVFADPVARPALLRALDDPDNGTRIYAIRGLSTLGRLGPTSRIKQILEEDEDAFVRRSMAWALERVDGRESAAAIRKSLADYDPTRIDSAQLGRAAPDFTLSDPSGTTYRLSQFRGNKDVILVFFIEDT